MVVAVGDVCFLKKSTESSLKETKAKKRKTLPAARKRSTLPYPCMQQQGFAWPRGGQQPASRSLPAVEGVRVAPEPNCPAQGLAQRLAPVTRFGHLLAELGQPPKAALRGWAVHATEPAGGTAPVPGVRSGGHAPCSCPAAPSSEPRSPPAFTEPGGERAYPQRCPAHGWRSGRFGSGPQQAFHNSATLRNCRGQGKGGKPNPNPAGEAAWQLAGRMP